MNRPRFLPTWSWLFVSWVSHVGLQAGGFYLALWQTAPIEARAFAWGLIPAWLVWEYANALKRKMRGQPTTWVDVLDHVGDVAAPVLFNLWGAS